MSTDLERYDPTSAAMSTIDLAPKAWKLAKAIAHTEFVPKALRGKEEAVLACILTGHELGISAMQSLAKIHVIEGRPALSAEMMRSIVTGQGHEIWPEELTNTRAVVKGKRRENDRVLTITWTLDDAKAAGLAGKDNWRKYPMDMLYARATGRLCRFMFADVLAGLSYTVEEIEDGDISDAPGLAGYEPPAPTDGAPAAPAKRTARAARKATAATPPPDAPPAQPDPPRGEIPPLPGEGDDESDIVDAEIVEPGGGDSNSSPSSEVEKPEEPQHDPGDDWHDQAPVDDGPRLTGPQTIAMMLGEHGIREQAERRRWVAQFVGHPVETTNDLTIDEIGTVIAHLHTLPADAILEAPPAQPRPVEAPRATAVTPPEEWDGNRWREFIKARGAKVTEVMKAAVRLGAESTPAVTIGTLDDLTGSGICADLVGWIEDRAT